MTERQIHVKVPLSLTQEFADWDITGEREARRKTQATIVSECERRGYEYLDTESAHVDSVSDTILVCCLVRTLPTPDFLLLP